VRFDQRIEAEIAIAKLNGKLLDGYTEPIVVKYANTPAKTIVSSPSCSTNKYKYTIKWHNTSSTTTSTNDTQSNSHKCIIFRMVYFCIQFRTRNRRKLFMATFWTIWSGSKRENHTGFANTKMQGIWFHNNDEL
jgi:hypothetical protein